MNPEDRAAAIERDLSERHAYGFPELIPWVATAIRDAVDTETEACARIADRHAGHTDASCAELVASVIRQRAEARSEAEARRAASLAKPASETL